MTLYILLGGNEKKLKFFYGLFSYPDSSHTITHLTQLLASILNYIPLFKGTILFLNFWLLSMQVSFLDRLLLLSCIQTLSSFNIGLLDLPSKKAWTLTSTTYSINSHSASCDLSTYIFCHICRNSGLRSSIVAKTLVVIYVKPVSFSVRLGWLYKWFCP